MVENIISYSIRKKFLILFSILVLSIASFWAVKNTSLDALPDLSPPQVIVQVKWAGQSPTEEFLIRNNNKCIYEPLKLINTHHRICHSCLTLKK